MSATSQEYSFDYIADDVERSIAEWLARYLADVLNLSVHEVKGTTSFEQYGLDSSGAVGLAGDLANWLGCNIDPTVTYEHPTINALAGALASNPMIRGAFENSVLRAWGEAQQCPSPPRYCREHPRKPYRL